MTAAYPLLLGLRGQPILVVGGGAVACRRVAGLVEAGGAPVVVAPEVTAELGDLAAHVRLVLHLRPYQAGEAATYRLVFAATDRREVNQQVARDARAGGAWVNLADDPVASDFHLPAVLRQGEVTVALTTGGSPVLTQRVRERLAATVTPGLGRAADRLARLRDEVRERWPADEGRRRRFWAELVSPEFVDDAVSGADPAVEERIAACLSQS